MIGRYPALTLKEARVKAHKLLGKKNEGREEYVDVPYKEAVERFLKVKEGEVRASTLVGYAHLLRSFNFPMVVRDIRPFNVGDALDEIPQQTKKSNAYAILKQFFTWCVAREYCLSNPLQNIKKPKPSAARDRVLTDDELVEIWNACRELDRYGLIVQVLMLTGQREAQIGKLQTSWIKNDWITFPKDNMKNTKGHSCPIGSLAKFVLMEAIPIEGYYFSPIGRVGRPFTAWSKSKKLLDSKIDIDPWRIHDLRRTWATNAARLDIPPHITARILSHTSEEGKVAKIYNRYRYEKEMEEAMDKMNDHILSLISADTM